MAQVTNAIAIVQCNAAVDPIDVGTANLKGILRFYSGTPPINPDTALSGNTLLAECLFSDPAFGGASDQSPGAMATASAIADDASANAGGVATFARSFSRDDNVVGQYTVAGSTGGVAEILITSSDANATIVISLPVSVSSFTYTQPEA